MDMIDIDFQNLSREILFWFHVVFVIAAVAVGFFVTPLLALALVALHRMHIFFFGDCLISKAQKKTGGLPEDMNFLQLAARRFFRQDISFKASRFLDYFLASMLVVIAFIK